MKIKTLIRCHTKLSLETLIFKSKITKSKLIELIKCFVFDDNDFKDYSVLDTIFFYKDYEDTVVSKVYKFIEKYSEDYEFLAFFVLTKKNSYNKCILLLSWYLNMFDYSLVKYKKIINFRGIKPHYKIVSYNSLNSMFQFKLFHYNPEYEYLIEDRIISSKIRFHTSREHRVLMNLNK